LFLFSETKKNFNNLVIFFKNQIKIENLLKKKNQFQITFFMNFSFCKNFNEKTSSRGNTSKKKESDDSIIQIELRVFLILQKFIRKKLIFFVTIADL